MKTAILNIAPGKTVDYHGEPCLVLEHRKDGTLLLHLEQMTHAFGSTNNFAASSLRAHLNGPYTVTDADSDTVTVKEYLDNVLKRTYTATLGQSNTVQCVTAANWQKVLNGAHTIKVVANDTKADSTPYTVTFTKAVYEASITLAEPMDADDTITVMVLNVLGSIPADADLEVLVTNNANDTEPVWEDATQDVKNGNNHVFTNQTAANGFAFNFKVNVGRGTSNTGGYITSIGGAFE